MPGMNHPLETERLALRPFTLDDAEAWHAIWGDREVIWWGASESFENSRTALERLLDRETEWPAGIGWLAVRRQGDDEIIGDVLLQPAPFAPGIEIGWHFRRHAWGKGYATAAYLYSVVATFAPLSRPRPPARCSTAAWTRARATASTRSSR